MPGRNAFENICLMGNPGSTAYRQPRTQRMIDELETTFPGQTYHLTTSPDRAEMRELIDGQVGDRDIVVVFGGDGAVHLTTQGMAGRKAMMMSVDIGNGNDNARMTNEQGITSISERILRAEPQPVHPINFHLRQPDSSEEEILGINYGGLGLSGIVAGRINHADHRNNFLYRHAAGRLIGEITESVRLTLRTSPIMVEHHTEQGGNWLHCIRDFSFVNGPRIAKLGRTPVALASPFIFAMPVGAPEPDSIRERAACGLYTMCALTTGRPQGFYISRPLKLGFPEGAPAHVDGETFSLEAGATLTISRHNEPVNLLTTR